MNFSVKDAVYTIQLMRAEESSGNLEKAVAVFQGLRPRLFGIAYRMLGSTAEAEDVVQDTWLRWQATDRTAVQEPTAFLVTAVTRLGINALHSARLQRETYIGPWLPEPVDTGNDPHLGAERGEALEMAVLLLLEKLSPTERAAYVLREAFDYPYAQIATLLETTEANCRQLVTRARKHVSEHRRSSVDAESQQRFLESFLSAAQRGDMQALEDLFAAEIVSLADGGGVVTAARIPLVGRERVAKVVASFATHFWQGVSLRRLDINGQPAALLMREDGPLAIVAVHATTDGIDHLMWVMNPAKLVQFSGEKLSQI